MVKIAVYTISKNEEQFVDRWVNSAEGADYLLIADTGSTDGTAERARAAGVRVESITVSPWRFDDARNASLALLPADIDFCIALDMDEVLVPGWRAMVDRAIAANPRANQFRYHYIHGWKADGTPGLTFYIAKLHARNGFRWRHPVHEYIYGVEPRFADIRDTLIEHHPDKTKSRGQYLPMLEMGARENPYDARMAHYYGRELMYFKRYDEALKEFDRHLALPSATWAPERAASMRFKARCLWQKREYEAAREILTRATTVSPNTREPWVELAQAFRYFKQWSMCEFACKQALAITDNSIYFNDPTAWSDWPERMLAEAQEKQREALDALSQPDIPRQLAAFGELAAFADRVNGISRKRKSDRKIAVYAIAKNEEKHVERWLRSAAGADHLLIADTGSTDRTVELARQGGARVESIEISPWRFDAARNASLALLPEDVDWCIWLDLDEVLVPGWRDIVEDALDAHPESNILGFDYVYDWASGGAPRSVFQRHKLHARHGLRWTGAVHEEVTGEDVRKVSIETTLVEHYPDHTKSRADYIDLLKIRIGEEPDNIRLVHRMGCELMNNNRLREAIACFEQHGNSDAHWAAERASSFRFKASCHWALKEFPEARAALLRATEISPDTREPWVELAQDYRAHGMWAECQYACERALAITDKPNSYLNTHAAWSDWPERMLAEAVQKQKALSPSPAPKSGKLKIAVYTISKNEETFIERWASSARDADYLLLADTGSTDGTIDVARRNGVVVRNLDLSPWRFDVARNISMDMVPEDADFCICMDVDEVLVPGWRGILESAIAANPHATRFTYKFVHSWHADGRPLSIMNKEKIHVREGFRWKGAVHEVLVSENDVAAHIDVPWLIEHHQDLSKSRSSYLPLMKIAVEENPEDDRMAHYYARELMFHSSYEEALVQFDRHLALKSARWKPERAASLRFKARCHWALGRLDLAREALLKAVEESPDTREPWVELAQDYRFHKMWAECRAACERALAIKVKPNFYLDMPSAWSDWPEKMLRESIRNQAEADVAGPGGSPARQGMAGAEA